jgi:hypothetical protein
MFLAAVSTVLLVSTAASSPAPGPGCVRCICVGGPGPEEAARQSSHAFIGYTLDEQRGEGLITRYTFRVERGWRGAGLADTVVVQAEHAGDCGALFAPGERYVVIGGERNGEPYLTACAEATQFGSAAAQRVLTALGPPIREGASADALLARLAPGPFPGDSVLVTGQIMRPGGGGIAQGKVELVPSALIRNTDSDGVFHFGLVPAGFYVLETTVDGQVERQPFLVRCFETWRSASMCATSSRVVVIGREPLPERGH